MIRFARLDPEGKDNVTVMKKDKTIAGCQDNMVFSGSHDQINQDNSLKHSRFIFNGKRWMMKIMELWNHPKQQVLNGNNCDW